MGLLLYAQVGRANIPARLTAVLFVNRSNFDELVLDLADVGYSCY